MKLQNGILCLALCVLPALARQVNVQTSAELLAATQAAVAGDTILVAPGTYVGDTTLSGDPGLPHGKGFFWIGGKGTAADPIVVVAQDPANPPTLQGSGLGVYVPGTTAPVNMTGTTNYAAYGIHVTGAYVYLKNLKITYANKGVIFDHSDHGLLEDCEVYNTGAEIIHVRDSAQYTVINRNWIHGSGNLTVNYGEGVYIGTDQARWGASDIPADSTITPGWGSKAITEGYGGYDWRTHYTTASNNFMEDIAAEPFDVKEGTQWTWVTGNVINGDSIGRKGGSTYFSYVGSFIDQKGVKGTMANNTFYDANNPVNSSASNGMTAYCAEIYRGAYKHVPLSLTAAAYSKPWFDNKLADSNFCALANNHVATTVPADPRPTATATYLNYHNPAYVTNPSAPPANPYIPNGPSAVRRSSLPRPVSYGPHLLYDLLGRVQGSK